MKKIGNIMLALLVLSLFTVQAKHQAENLSTYTVAMQQNVMTELYFQGSIQPLKTEDVISPIAGLVAEDLGFTYGAFVKKGELLMAIAPTDEQNAYRTALLGYLRAKTSYQNAHAKFSGQELLYQQGILARNDFAEYQTSLADLKLAQEEAFFTLKAAVEKITDKNKLTADYFTSLANLTLSDKSVYSQLNRNFSKINVNAPKSGIALLPLSDNDNKPNALYKNASVKLNQNLVTIGDFSGLKIKIDVNEVSINKLSVGQSAEVTGPAFSNITLKGTVDTISYQAKPAAYSGDVPTYPVTIVVPALTVDQQKIIHVGMSANVKIIINNGAQIQIPFVAIVLKDNEPYVKLLDSNGKSELRKITTGQTTLDKIEVMSGLHAGEKIVISH
jgi:HlyD family secretion protein